MTRAQQVCMVLLAGLLIASSVAHLLNPDLSSGFIPDWMPKTFVHVATAIVEFALGIAVFMPGMRKTALTGIFLLMIAFLPLHIADLFRSEPVIGSLAAAVVRVPVQLLLIGMAWYAGGRFPNWKQLGTAPE